MIRILRQAAHRIAELLHTGADSGTLRERDTPQSATASPDSPRAAIVRRDHLMGVEGISAEQIIPLINTRFVIGRDGAVCDLSIPSDSRISPEHALLSREGHSWYCADLGWTTGTYLDTARIGQTAARVVPGSVLRCGEQAWRVEYGKTAEAAEASPAPLRETERIAPMAKQKRKPIQFVPFGKKSTDDYDEEEDEFPSFKEDPLSFEQMVSGVFGRTPSAPPARPAPQTAPPERATPQTGPREDGRWLAPGEAAKVQGISLPDGMIYLGASLRSLSGSNSDAALIVPAAKIAPPGRGVANPEDYLGYYPAYSTAQPQARRFYLEWLSNGRRDPYTDIAFVFMFYYGLERRLLTPILQPARLSTKEEPALKVEESVALRREILGLMQVYDHPAFQQHTSSLLQFLLVKDILENASATALPDVELVATLPRTGFDLPPLLTLALSRIAAQKRPLSADWAWIWFVQDSESNLHGAFLRCLDAVRRLFIARFSAASERKGILLRLEKPTVALSYSMANTSCRVRVVLETGKNTTPIHPVSRTPLKFIRETADACIDALDGYSRRIARTPEQGNTLPVAALLPDPLFAEHPAVVRFRAYLDALVPRESGASATLPIAALLAQWQSQNQAVGQADQSAAVSRASEDTPEAANVTSLTRSNALTLLETMDRLGFVVEPDLRFGGAGLTVGKEGSVVAGVARRGGEAVLTDPIVLAVALPLLVRAARIAGDAGLSANVSDLAHRLPRAETGDPARIAARFAYLTANAKESAKLPKRQEPALSDLTPDERAQIADVLAAAASLSGTVGPAAVAEVIRLFALLGLPDSEVFARLHASASAPSIGNASRGDRRGASPDEPLAAIQSGSRATGFVIPKPPPKLPPKAAKKAGVTIDLELVKQKEAESAQISSLLADIFTEEEGTGRKQGEFGSVAPVAAPPPSVPAPENGAASGALDARHAGLLRALLAQDAWSKAEVAILARAENLLPNAAIETINEAAFERFDEPVLEGEDPIYVSIQFARELLS